MTEPSAEQVRRFLSGEMPLTEMAECWPSLHAIAEARKGQLYAQFFDECEDEEPVETSQGQTELRASEGGATQVSTTAAVATLDPIPSTAEGQDMSDKVTETTHVGRSETYSELSGVLMRSKLEELERRVNAIETPMWASLTSSVRGGLRSLGEWSKRVFRNREVNVFLLGLAAGLVIVLFFWWLLSALTTTGVQGAVDDPEATASHDCVDPCDDPSCTGYDAVLYAEAVIPNAEPPDAKPTIILRATPEVGAQLTPEPDELPDSTPDSVDDELLAHCENDMCWSPKCRGFDATMCGLMNAEWGESKRRNDETRCSDPACDLCASPMCRRPFDVAGPRFDGNLVAGEGDPVLSFDESQHTLYTPNECVTNGPFMVAKVSSGHSFFLESTPTPKTLVFRVWYSALKTSYTVPRCRGVLHFGSVMQFSTPGFYIVTAHQFEHDQWWDFAIDEPRTSRWWATNGPRLHGQVLPSREADRRMRAIALERGLPMLDSDDNVHPYESLENSWAQLRSSNTIDRDTAVQVWASRGADSSPVLQGFAMGGSSVDVGQVNSVCFVPVIRDNSSWRTARARCRSGTREFAVWDSGGPVRMEFAIVRVRDRATSIALEQLP